MKYNLEYISTFHSDIIDIASNLEEYPQKAKRIFEMMDKKLLNLIDSPELYPVYSDFPAFRRIVIDDYLLFYIINEKAKIIEVHRLIYGRMDVIAQLSLDTCTAAPEAQL